PEGSNGKAFRSCAVGVPDRSWLRSEIAGRAFRRRVHGHSATGGSACCRSSPVLPPSSYEGNARCRSLPPRPPTASGGGVTYQVLARKWRPQAFEAVVGQDPVTRTLQNAAKSGRVGQAYLVTAPRGVGKTTPARLLAKALACTQRTGPEACNVCPSCQDFVSGAPVDVMEIDAASNTGVDDIRTLRENVKYAPARGRFKIYIVDEVHMLSGPAFN